MFRKFLYHKSHIVNLNNMRYQTYLSVAVATLLLGLTVTGSAFAQTGTGAGMMFPNPPVIGKVTAVSGTTLTVEAQKLPEPPTMTPGQNPPDNPPTPPAPGSRQTVTYTVNASNATVVKDGQTS